jgi:DNA-binding YbaB/EbfC family protein
MKDMQRMMKEAQKMAAQVQKAQADLADAHFEGTAGGGVVSAVATGDGRIVSVTISPDFFEGAPDADDIEMLSDTVTAAVGDALTKAQEAQQEVLGPLTGGMGGLGLPGM